jgi:hypothetical protein
MTEQTDAVLGALTINPEYGEIHAASGDISFILESQEAIPHARHVVSNLGDFAAAAKAFAATQLLSIKNETWIDEDDDGNAIIVSAEEFQNRMTLESVSINADSSTSFFFADGDLFYGHSIVVDHDGKAWTEASTAG